MLGVDIGAFLHRFCHSRGLHPQGVSGAIRSPGASAWCLLGDRSVSTQRATTAICSQHEEVVMAGAVPEASRP